MRALCTRFVATMFLPLALAAAVLLPPQAHAQIGTIFTYQGELIDGGVPYSGACDLRVSLWNAAAAGSQVGSALTFSNITTDALGRFTIQPDFGLAVPANSHLEIEVRTPHDPTDSLPYITLSPRQPVHAAPLARTAQTATSATTASSAAVASTANNALALNGQNAAFYQSASNLNAGTLSATRLSGAYTNALTLSSASNAFTGSGAGLTALNAGNVSTGTLSPARGGTGSSVSVAVVGHVLKWNGTAFTTQPDTDTDTNTTYSAGAGLNLTGTTFSIPTNGVTTGMLLEGTVSAQDIGASQVNNSHLTTDAASLVKVSGTAMRSDGANIGIGSAAPAATLHLQTTTPILSVQSTTNGGDATLNLTETVSGDGLGGRLFYDGGANTLVIGTVADAAGVLEPAMTIDRGTPNVAFAGGITIPATTRHFGIPAAGFSVNAAGPSATLSTGTTPRIVEGTTATVFASAAVHLPQGAVVTEFLANVAGGASPNTVTVTLERQTYAGVVTSSALASVSSPAGGGTFAPLTTTAISNATIDNATYSYRVEVSWPDPGSHVADFYGVRITYTITSPLP
ncbi:MAG: hypothetical protein ACKVS8_04890 [Phycisphaerales bacterium]